MPLPALLFPFLAAAVQPPLSERDIIVTGHSGPPFVSPMGEPFRARAVGEDTLATWFRQADRNQDGTITVDEMQADADRFFARLDVNHDGEIDPDELVQYEWQLAPEIQVNSKMRRPRSTAAADPAQNNGGKRRARDRDEPDDLNGLQGGARYALLNIPEPVAAADTDFNRAITRDEFRAAATGRFQLLDTNRQGRLGLPQLEALLPRIPGPGEKPKRRTDEADTRIGNPLPKAN